MNSHKFCFIICTNDELMLSECLHYIRHLEIPQGYDIDLLTIKDAPCMTSAYQSAMSDSDAKYKIYLHQDVFILNKNILMDLLDIFSSDPLIGMIGVVGYETVSSDGIMWHTPRKGTVYSPKSAMSYPLLSKYRYSLQEDGYSYVAEIDGLFIATAYDLPWDTVQLKGWDFYDAFQSMNFLKNGYRIAVPSQKHPWCLHDDNVLLNMTQYDFYRKLFCSRYQNLLGKSYAQISEMFKQNN